MPLAMNIVPASNSSFSYSIGHICWKVSAFFTFFHFKCWRSRGKQSEKRNTGEREATLGRGNGLYVVYVCELTILAFSWIV